MRESGRDITSAAANDKRCANVPDTKTPHADAHGLISTRIRSGNAGGLERVAGIEPAYSAWKAAALPLSYTRAFASAFDRQWWRELDLNQRRHSQRIYSPSPLTTRAPLRTAVEACRRLAWLLEAFGAGPSVSERPYDGLGAICQRRMALEIASNFTRRPSRPHETGCPTCCALGTEAGPRGDRRFLRIAGWDREAA